MSIEATVSFLVALPLSVVVHLFLGLPLTWTGMALVVAGILMTLTAWESVACMGLHADEDVT